MDTEEAALTKDLIVEPDGSFLEEQLGVSCASARREWRNLADAPDLGSGARKGVGVQIPPLAQVCN